MEWNPQVTPRQVALVCHPHPMFGGTMHNKVVFRAAKAALYSGLPTLRFNFRGAGKSVGTFDGGDGERDDVRAALDYLARYFPGLPVCLMGFSFGSWVGLAVGAGNSRVSALVGLGVPVNSSSFDFLREVRKPKLILQGTRDEFGSVAQVSELYDSLPEPKQIHWVEGADHFFAGKLDEVQQVLQEFLAPFVNENA
jgi:alpha/beta superfamily hydrolase